MKLKIRTHTSLLLLGFSFSTVLAQSNNSHQSDSIISIMVSGIETTVSSEFIYEYEGSKFVPPVGQTLLIMGQTEERINEYLKIFPNKPLPGGWSAYWGVTEFKGIKESYKNETGSSQYHQMLADRFPNAVIHSAMWMVGNWNIAKNTYLGKYDKVLKKYGKWAKSINKPIYLRIGYEFDGAHNQLEPLEYVWAYKHIVDFFRKEGVENIAYVWHSYAAPPYKDYALSKWYPGDDYVDWVGISVFGQGYDSTDFGTWTDDVLQFAKNHQKPVMVAEASPIKGIKQSENSAWNDWFVNLFSFCYKKNIKAIAFINEDWPSTTIPGISDWQDARLYNNPEIANAWFKETSKERYLKQSEDLFKQLGYN